MEWHAVMVVCDEAMAVSVLACLTLPKQTIQFCPYHMDTMYHGISMTVDYQGWSRGFGFGT